MFIIDTTACLFLHVHVLLVFISVGIGHG